MDNNESIKKYYVNGLEKRELYEKFIEYMISISDAFCLVYLGIIIKKNIQKPLKRYARNLHRIKNTNGLLMSGRALRLIMPKNTSIFIHYTKYLMR